MNKRLKTSILLVAVVIVWGIIAYKFFTTINPETPTLKVDAKSIVFKPETHKIDTFSIQSLNKDPFLGTYAKVHKVAKIKPRITKKTKPSINITYHGLISQQEADNHIYIITISGTQYLMKLKQTVQGVKLLKGNMNQVTLNYNGSKKVVKKQ
ncbi:hypothetical protein [Neotamlana laminarinivorans]|uniref:Uncharacterized protein n=1 Tax=Neotamlana laminarinivorans TaxID=2883124 RepID=A0A9X1HZA9_9FLAO|nr:hypothetical protein [Tamlana laminarinivorans]MCB4797237.1 hypothetical protein [Tamlana laminarinivorans]